FAGQSPGRGEVRAAGGTGRPGAAEDALDEPQPAAAAVNPIAAMVFRSAAPPAARPPPARNSRRPVRLSRFIDGACAGDRLNGSCSHLLPLPRRGLKLFLKSSHRPSTPPLVIRSGFVQRMCELKVR